MKKNLLVITKVDSIKGLKSKLKKKYNILYLPDATMNQLNQIDKIEKKKISAIFTNPNKTKIKLDNLVLNKFSNLEVICTASTGLIHIDVDLCKKKDIKIISLTKDHDILKNISSTAELAFLLMMLGVRNVINSSKDVMKGNWDCEKFVGRQINYLNVGVIGFGRLGKMFAKYAKTFGSRVYVYDPFIKNFNKYSDYYFVKTLNKLAKKVDVVSLHIHVNNKTKGMINKKFFKNCNDNILMINTSRGEIINDLDLLCFLKKNKKSKYLTDVLSNEFYGLKNNPIFKAFKNKNFENQILITPHIGGMTHDARYLAYHRAANELIKYHFNYDN
jgi:D-3-phosphoglycerate dehydrogenase / 2-oxoglutarate reductase